MKRRSKQKTLLKSRRKTNRANFKKKFSKRKVIRGPHGGSRLNAGRWSNAEIEAIESGKSDIDVAQRWGRTVEIVKAKRTELKARPFKKTAIPAEPKKDGVDVQAMLNAIAASGANKRAKDRKPETNPFQIPQFPPQATPPKKFQMAMDSNLGWASNQWATGNGYPLDYLGAEGLQFFGYPYLSELAQRPEYRVISETIADDATRKWIDFEVTGDEEERAAAAEEDPAGEAERMADPDERKKRVGKAGKTDKVKALKDELARLEARDRFYTIAVNDGLFGRSHLFLDFGQDLDDPKIEDELKTPIGDGRDVTSRKKIKKGSLKNLKTVEPVWVYPTTYNAINPLKENWYNPEIWWVLGKQVHRSRMPVFVGHPVPDLLKPAYSFGGLSLSQMAKPYVDIWLQTRESVGVLIHSFSVMVLMTDLQTILQNPTADGLLTRVALFNALRDNQGTFVLNKATEDFKNVSASLAGLHELQAQAQEHLCLPADAMIETNRGQVPISEVTVNDQVMTRNGFAPIDWVGITGYTNRLIELTAGNCVVKVTGCHPIYLPEIDEFVSAENVPPSAILAESQSWENTESPYYGEDDGGERQRPDIIETSKLADYSIGKSGLLTGGRYLKVLSFIILTKILTTTIFPICSRLIGVATPSFILRGAGSALTNSIPVKQSACDAAHYFVLSFLIGRSFAVQNAVRVIRDIVVIHREKFARLLALIVGMLSNPLIRQRNIAAFNVSGVDTLEFSCRSSNYAWPVAQASSQPVRAINGAVRNATSRYSCVSVEKKRVIELDHNIPVYNLRVSDPYLHEFFANGICVSNCSVSRIPLVKLTGISPSGLNASSEYEVRSYYDTIAAYQNRFFRPHLTRIINFAQLSLWGEIDPELTFNFEPLWELSEKEIADLQKAEAERDQTYVDMGAFSAEEIRKIKIDDPKLPYTNLQPEDTPDLREEEIHGLEPEGGRPDPLAEQGPELGNEPDPSAKGGKAD